MLQLMLNTTLNGKFNFAEFKSLMLLLKAMFPEFSAKFDNVDFC